MTVDTVAVLELMKQVAAEVITPRFRALADGEVIEKNPGDLVTVADREAVDGRVGEDPPGPVRPFTFS